MKNRLGVACLIAALGVLVGCAKGDDDDTNGGTGGVPGSGGILGTGGDVGVGGSGGAAAGSGGGAAGATATGECAMADMTMTPAALHAAAAALIAADKPCAFSGCHGGSVPAGMLQLAGSTDLHAALAGKPSCEAPNLPLVDPSGGDAALNNSWLWIKLTAPADDTAGLTTPQATWGTPGTCGQMPGMMYGVRMPWGSGGTPNSEARLTPIRNWICAGAPGPM